MLVRIESKRREVFRDLLIEYNLNGGDSEAVLRVVELQEQVE